MTATCHSPWSAEDLLMEGRLAEARDEYWRDADAAEAAGDAVALATAAIGLGGLWVHEHRATVERARVRAVQRRALDGLDPSHPLAVRLRARLAAEDAYVAGDPAPALAAVAEARAGADAVALAEALSIAHHCLLGPAHVGERLAMADELIETATRSGRPVDVVMGLAWRTVDLLLAGDRRAPRSVRELRERLAVQRCDALAFVVAAIDVTMAMRAGDLADAERLAESCFAIGIAAGDADAEGWFGAQLLSIRWMQGRSAELLRPRPRPRPGADGDRVQPRVRCGHRVRCRSGRRGRPRPPRARRPACPWPGHVLCGELLADHACGDRRGGAHPRRRIAGR